MDADQAVELARTYFLDSQNLYGCAETTFMALKDAFGLPQPGDSSAAMALNGGIAYRGSTCGALTGAVLAVGMLAERRIPDHRLAKRTARRLIDQLADQFQSKHGATDCRVLIETDIHDERSHANFIRSGLWRTRCMDQIETVIRLLLPLAAEDAWQDLPTIPGTS